MAGNEANYRIHRVSSGTATDFPNQCPAAPCVDTGANTAIINNVSQFSDWALAEFTPTAAAVSVSGRVTANRRGVSRARVILTASSGETRIALTNPFGFYRFDEVLVGAAYAFDVRHKSYSFAPRVVTITEESDSVNFTPQGK